MYDNVLIATDGSDEAEGAIDHGLDLAEKVGAKVHVLYVVETKANYILTVGLSDDELRSYRKYGEEVVTRVIDRASERGLSGEGVIRTGRPAAEIVDYGAENDVDLILLGKQGHGAIDRHLGSTSEKVIRMADTPVTVVAGAQWTS
ncbi:universal stress protein [Natronococcus occultus]|uniref:Universal stress protein UspA-like protein n=1 Tax=Natronococcus occultus SP4 TaxID=694430 RepID=L0JYQ0_9EURY|nr:universal stress protein [Natronococcus occultus]AGB37234.1 universal stress protein UspA-like protein [Natronococcus occultus SP4]